MDRAVRTSREFEQVLAANSILDGVDADDVLRALRDDGVDSLERLVERSLDTHRRTLGGRRRAVPIVDRSWRQPPSDAVTDPGPIRHQVPECELIIDGVSYEPADITRFDASPLHTIVAANSRGEPVLYAFTENLAEQALRARLAMRVLGGSIGDPGYAPPTGQGTTGCGFMGAQPCFGGSGGGSGGGSSKTPPQYTGTVQMFDDINYEGNWFWLEVGYWWPDLTEVTRGRFLFWSSDWNDQISALSATSTNVLYFEHIYKGGSSLLVRPGLALNDLRAIGWNDRISSVAHFP
jgi:hypothetical protein